MEIERLKEEVRQQKDWDDRLRSQVNRHFKQKSEDFDKLYRNYKKLETDYDRQQDKLMQARAKLKQKTEALTMQEKLLEERTTQLLTDVAKERLEMLDTQNQITEQSQMVLEKVQTTNPNPEL